jgi:hypothetical protein
MRRAFAWLTGLVSVAALARLLRRRQRAGSEPQLPVDDPAEQLRGTLARTRASEPGEAPAPELEPDPASPEERRARVHERAQETIDQMRDQPEQQ